MVAAGITALVAWPRAQDSVPEDGGTDVSLIDVPSLEEEMAAASQTPKPSATPSMTPSQTAKPSQTGANGSGSISLKKPVDA